MINRYSIPEITKIWSDENKFNLFWSYEKDYLLFLQKHFSFPLSNKINEISISVPEIERIEATSKHDVIAFLSHIENLLGDDSHYVHYGLTSNDVIDSVNAYRIHQSFSLISEKLYNISGSLLILKNKYFNEKIIGRTHGIFAEPTTLGHIFSSYLEELSFIEEKIFALKYYVKSHGAVGNCNAFPESALFSINKDWSLINKNPAFTFSEYPSQIVSRLYFVDYFYILSLISSWVEKIATNIRLYQRTEVSEIFEPFSKNQKGSSAMPHKRNPILTENLCGLSRLVRSYLTPALENVTVWHERDLAHSSVERVSFPDAFHLTGFMVDRLNYVLSNLVIDSDNIQDNISKSNGLIFSEHVLLKLVRKNIKRQTAYSWIQECAFKDKNFKSNLISHEEVSKHLSQKEIEDIF